MKKVTLIFALLSMFIAPASLFAASGTVYTGILEMGDITDTTSAGKTGVEVSLSPSIRAVYVQPTAAADKEEAQWYAIAAGHPGGTTVYATAQNITNIYTKGIADATELNAVLGEVPESKVSESDWSDNDWVK